MANRTNNVWGIGVNNEGKYKSRVNGKHTIVYNAWCCMLQRCYDNKLHLRNPTYKDCRVCEEWLNFQTFAKWFTENYKNGYQLDKDLLVKGNKVYSPETCCFVPKEINLLILNPSKPSKDKLPHGVQKWRDGFRVKLRVFNKQKHIGCYKTIIGAFSAYKSAKEYHVRSVAEKYKESINSKVYQALLEYTVDFNN